MKKEKFAIMLLIMTAILLAVNIETKPGNKYLVETGLSAVNPYDYEVVTDSTIIHISTHKLSTTYHSKGDATTEIPTGSTFTLPEAIVYWNDVREFLAEHFEQDSCHLGADTTTTLPTELSANQTPEALKTYVDSLIRSSNAHDGLVMTDKQYILADEISIAWTAHGAKDTTDVDSCHIAPDVTYNIVAIDTTNQDSLIAGLNRFKNRYIQHIDSETYHVISDSTNLWNETLFPDLTSTSTWTEIFDFENYAKDRYNSHVAFETDSVHVKADTNLLTRADLVKNGGHKIADPNTWTGFGHLVYDLFSFRQIYFQYTGSSVTTGGVFYNLGSIDGTTWAFIDSTIVSSNLPVTKHLTNFYPYYKTYLKSRVDGTFKVEFEGVK